MTPSKKYSSLPVEEDHQKQCQVIHCISVLLLNANDAWWPERSIEALHLVPGKEVKLEQVLHHHNDLRREKRGYFRDISNSQQREN